MRIRALPLIASCAAALLSAACDSPAGPRGPGVPARLDLVSGDGQEATAGTELPLPLVVRILDEDGNPVPGKIVNFRVVSGGGSVFAGSSQTNAQGEARERWTLGTTAADSQRVEARAVDAATGQALVFGTFGATARAGVPAVVVPVGPAARTGTAGAPLADSVGVTVRDQHGNPVPGATVVWTVRSGGGSVSPVTTQTGVSGISRATWTLGARVDSAQVLDAAAGISLVTQFTATAAVPTGAALVVRSGSAQTATVATALPQPVRVALLSSMGAPIVGAPVTWTTAAGTVSPYTSVTDAAGEASVTWTLGTTAGVQSLAASSPGAAPVGVSATATPGPAAELVKLSGDAQSAPVNTQLPQALAVAVTDQYQNRVPGAAVTYAVTGGGGAVNPASGTTDASGRFSTAWTLGSTVGAQSLRASSGSLAPVTFSAQGTSFSAPTLRIAVPAANRVVADSFFLIAQGSSPQLVSATATVEDRTFPLRLTGGPEFSGWIVMPAGAPGPREVVVRASTTSGDSAIGRITVVLDRPPRLQVTSPVEGYVARPEVPVVAECMDDDPAGCAAITVSFGPSGTTSLNTTISLASLEGRKVRLSITGRDSRGQTATSAYDVFVQSSPTWTEVARAPAGWLLDYDPSRLLYGTWLGQWSSAPRGFEVRLRDRASGGETALRTVPNGVVSGNDRVGHLHPNGAIFTASGGFDWRNGNLATLEGGGTDLRVEGNWAAWRGLYRRNLTTGVTQQLYKESSAHDVAADGDVVFSTYYPYRYDVYRYRNGSAELISIPGDTLWNLNPVTDGVNVVYTRGNSPSAGTQQRSSIVMVGPDGRIELAGPRAGGLQYAATNGWVAFTLVDVSAASQVWVRSPGGTIRQATFGSSASLQSLGPNGEVVFISGGRYRVVRAPYTAPPLDIGAAAVPYPEARFAWRQGELVAFLGRSAFRVDF